MAYRQRFKPRERATFTKGTPVEWLNGSHWQPGTIIRFHRKLLRTDHESREDPDREPG